MSQFTITLFDKFSLLLFHEIIPTQIATMANDTSDTQQEKLDLTQDN